MDVKWGNGLFGKGARNIPLHLRQNKDVCSIKSPPTLLSLSELFFATNNPLFCNAQVMHSFVRTLCMAVYY